ncbi:copper resistance CopC family protein [Sinosporangium album]|uniref:copper resistance CopC family protein n=1 Tax=Sinosporangium album TaxID=504805 RepID=UPI000B813EC0|nr:copper resistance CopC family protein [Sinosporangium album]
MRRLLTALMLAGAALLVGASPAQAHNVLTGSDPKDGATIAEAPDTITLEFDQTVRQGFSQVTVIGPGESRWEEGKPEVDGPKVTAKVRPLGPAGEYVVGYRVLSADGHPISGKITFKLSQDGPGARPEDAGQSAEPAATASAAAPASPAAPQGPDLSAQAAEAAQNGGAAMAVVWVAAALVLLGIGTIVALRRARPSGERPQEGVAG